MCHVHSPQHNDKSTLAPIIFLPSTSYSWQPFISFVNDIPVSSTNKSNYSSNQRSGELWMFQFVKKMTYPKRKVTCSGKQNAFVKNEARKPQN